MKKKGKILIVGGTGFIGFHLAKRLLKKKFNVTSISAHKPKKIRFLKRIKYIVCDISNNKKLNEKLDLNFQYVVNLGGYVDHSNKDKTYKSHFLGCKNLANFFVKQPCLEKFIQIGSSLEYGNQKSPQQESLIGSPKSIYSKAKYLATNFLINQYRKNKLPVTILRLYQIYGPYQDVNRFLPILITSCLKDKKFPCSNGNQYRDFLYVDDLISAIEKILTNKKSNGEILNIGMGKPIKIRHLINLVKKKINKGKPQFGKIKLRKDESFKTYPNIEKIKKFIKWSPKSNIEKKLNSLINFYKKNSIYYS